MCRLLGALLFSAIASGLISPVAAQDRLRFAALQFAPFIYGENEAVAESGRGIIAGVCERAQVACSFDIYPWRRAEELMRSGDADRMMLIRGNAEH